MGYGFDGNGAYWLRTQSQRPSRAGRVRRMPSGWSDDIRSVFSFGMYYLPKIFHNFEAKLAENRLISFY